MEGLKIREEEGVVMWWAFLAHLVFIGITDLPISVKRGGASRFRYSYLSNKRACSLILLHSLIFMEVIE